MGFVTNDLQQCYICIEYQGHKTLRILTKEMTETRSPRLSCATRILNKCPNCETEIDHTPSCFKESIWLTSNQIQIPIYQTQREKSLLPNPFKKPLFVKLLRLDNYCYYCFLCGLKVL